MNDVVRDVWNVNHFAFNRKTTERIEMEMGREVAAKNCCGGFYVSWLQELDSAVSVLCHWLVHALGRRSVRARGVARTNPGFVPLRESGTIPEDIAGETSPFL